MNGPLKTTPTLRAAYLRRDQVPTQGSLRSGRAAVASAEGDGARTGALGNKHSGSIQAHSLTHILRLLLPAYLETVSSVAPSQ